MIEVVLLDGLRVRVPAGFAGEDLERVLRILGRAQSVLTLPASVRIYVAAEAVDLRRGFDGLAAATRGLISATR